MDSLRMLTELRQESDPGQVVMALERLAHGRRDRGRIQPAWMTVVMPQAAPLHASVTLEQMGRIVELLDLLKGAWSRYQGFRVASQYAGLYEALNIDGYTTRPM